MKKMFKKAPSRNNLSVSVQVFLFYLCNPTKSLSKVEG